MKKIFLFLFISAQYLFAQGFNIIGYEIFEDKIFIQYENEYVSIYQIKEKIHLLEPSIISEYDGYNSSKKHQKYNLESIGNKNLILSSIKANQDQMIDLYKFDLNSKEIIKIGSDYSVSGFLNSKQTHYIKWNGSKTDIFTISTAELNEIKLPDSLGYTLILDYFAENNEFLIKRKNSSDKYYFSIYNHKTGKTSMKFDPNFSTIRRFGNFIYFEPIENSGKKPIIYDFKNKSKRTIELTKEIKKCELSNDGKTFVYKDNGMLYWYNFETKTATKLNIKIDPNYFLLNDYNKQLTYASKNKIYTYSFSLKKNIDSIQLDEASIQNLNVIYPCKFSTKKKESKTYSLNSLTKIEKDKYSWTTSAKSFDDLDTQYGDLNGDGAEDILLDYEQSEIIDILFGDGKGGYKGYFTYSIPKAFYKKCAIIDRRIIINNYKNDDELHLIFASNNNSFDVVEKIGTTGKFTNSNCEYCEKNGKVDTVENVYPREKFFENTKNRFLFNEEENIDFNKDNQKDFLGSGVVKEAPRNPDQFLLRHPDDKWGVILRINEQRKSWELPAEPYTLETGDFDGDGLLDFAVGSNQFNGFYFYFNNGKGVDFTEKKFESNLKDVFHFEVQDFNGDGLAEIAIKDKTDLYLIGSDKKRNLKVKSSANHIKTSYLTYQNFTDIDYDGIFDYISLSNKNSTMEINSYIGLIKDSTYKLVGPEDLSFDIEAYSKKYSKPVFRQLSESEKSVEIKSEKAKELLAYAGIENKRKVRESFTKIYTTFQNYTVVTENIHEMGSFYTTEKFSSLDYKNYVVSGEDLYIYDRDRSFEPKHYYIIASDYKTFDGIEAKIYLIAFSKDEKTKYALYYFSERPNQLITISENFLFTVIKSN